MRIKAVCLEHKNAVVVLLEATTSYQTFDKIAVREDSENATYVELDEANLYCTHDGGEHRVGFVVETQSFDENGNCIGNGTDV